MLLLDGTCMSPVRTCPAGVAFACGLLVMISYRDAAFSQSDRDFYCEAHLALRSESSMYHDD